MEVERATFGWASCPKSHFCPTGTLARTEIQCGTRTTMTYTYTYTSLSQLYPLPPHVHILWLSYRIYQKFVIQCINYKLALLAYKIKTISALEYQRSLQQPHDHHNIRSLRSSAAPGFVVLPTQTEIRKRAFGVSAQTVWNALPSCWI